MGLGDLLVSAGVGEPPYLARAQTGPLIGGKHALLVGLGDEDEQVPGEYLRLRVGEQYCVVPDQWGYPAGLIAGQFAERVPAAPGGAQHGVDVDR